MSDAPLVDLAEAILAALATHWPPPDDALPHLQPLPERRYAWVGTAPARDCEQVTVGIDRTFGAIGDPSQERIVPIGSGVPYLRTMVASIEIMRCVTVVDQNQLAPVWPDPDTVSAETFTQLTDADVVLDCLIAAQAAGELANCGGLALENWRAVTAAGGLSGGATRLRLNLF